MGVQPIAMSKTASYQIFSPDSHHLHSSIRLPYQIIFKRIRFIIDAAFL